MLAYGIMIGVPALITVFVRLSKLLKSNSFSDKNVIYRYLEKYAAIDTFFVIFLFLLSFRDISCGIDLYNYKKFFDCVLYRSEVDVGAQYSLEFGYVIFQSVVANLTKNFYMLMVLCAFVSVIPLWIFYRKESENAYLTVILFATVAPFVFYFSGLRQIMAMTLGIPAYYLAKKKKIKLFLIVVALAWALHQSALILLSLYVILNVRVTKKWMLGIGPAILAVFLLRNKLFGILLYFMGESYFGKYSGQSNGSGGYSMLILFVIFLIYSFVIPNEDELDMDVIGLRNILIVIVGIQCFASVHPIAMRINYYFLIFIPILIPKLVTRCKENLKWLADLSVVVMTLFFTFWFFYFGLTDADILQVFPYVPFWSKI